MKKVVFDIDGVLLSEERYYDVSALVVWEILFSPLYMGLPSERDDFNHSSITEGQIAYCREKVWGKDKLISYLKSKGVNSNWNMVHIYMVTLLWIMAETFEQRSEGLKIQLSVHKHKDFQMLGQELMGLPLPTAEQILNKWKSIFTETDEGISLIHKLSKTVRPHIDNGDDFISLDSDFWKVETEAFQNWYLGDDLYIELLGHLPYAKGKEGFLKKEIPLAPAEKIKNVFQTLKNRGYEIGIATGRSKEEVLIPFKELGWLDEFETSMIGTFSEAKQAQNIFSIEVPDKPQGFIFYCGIYGTDEGNYKGYLEGTKILSREDEVYVCGDSYSDILGARNVGAKFIGVLTGLDGKNGISMFEKENVSYVENVVDILSLLPME